MDELSFECRLADNAVNNCFYFLFSTQRSDHFYLPTLKSYSAPYPETLCLHNTEVLLCSSTPYPEVLLYPLPVDPALPPTRRSCSTHYPEVLLYPLSGGPALPPTRRSCSTPYPEVLLYPLPGGPALPHTRRSCSTPTRRFCSTPTRRSCSTPYPECPVYPNSEVLSPPTWRSCCTPTRSFSPLGPSLSPPGSPFTSYPEALLYPLPGGPALPPTRRFCSTPYPEVLLYPLPGGPSLPLPGGTVHSPNPTRRSCLPQLCK
jgi:hypothetical protein